MNEQVSGKKLRWIVLFGFTAVVDIVQILIALTGVGVLVSEYIDGVMPFVLIGLLVLFKIPIFSHPARLFSILGITVGDALTGGVAPFWVLDVWYLYWSVRKAESAEAEASNEGSGTGVDEPLYREGRRKPVGPGSIQPLNQDEVRLPTDAKRSEENPLAA